MPQVSVVIPTYNGAKYIRESVESVLRQEYRDREIIVVDDGSTDGTRQLLEPYMRERAIRYLFQENGGPARARNTGIRAAQGRYLAFLDADDVWLPEKLALQMELLKRRPECLAVHTDLEVRDAGGGVLKNALYANAAREGWLFDDILLCRSWIFLSTVLVARTVIDNVGLFSETLPTAEDTNLLLRIARTYWFAFVGRVLVQRRSHGENMTEKGLRNVGTFRNLDDIAARYPDLRGPHSVLGRAYAVRYAMTGYSMFRKGDYRRARLLLGKALAYRLPDPKALVYYVASYMPAGLLGRLRQGTRSLRLRGKRAAPGNVL
jgi:glycosyltransferase involved in cell wall biosynthesis